MATVFTELFRIASSEIESLLDPEFERGSETSLWLRHLGDIELVGLWQALSGSQSGTTLMGDLLSDPEADQLVLSLPDDFLNSIESLGDDDVGATAETWSRMDELTDWEPRQLSQVIHDLRALVRDAKAHHQIVVQLAEL